MLKRISSSLIALFLTFAPAQADDVRKGLYELGFDICAKSMGNEISFFDGDQFREAVDAVSWERSEFCHCVGDEYATTGDAELLKDMVDEIFNDEDYFATNFTMHQNMTRCLPGQVKSEAEDSSTVEPDTASTSDFDENDVRLCQLAFDGEFPVPSFRADETLAEMKKGKQSRSGVCTCAARHIAAEGAQIENGSDYGWALSGAIEACVR